MAATPTRASLGDAAEIRRDYEGRKGLVPAQKVARDLAGILEGRRQVQRAAEALADAAAPYAGDARVAAALDGLRDAIEGKRA